jgi:hypothetical protein
VAGRWRETQEKQQFYSFGAAASRPKTIVPGRIGIAKLWHSLRQLTCQAV